MLGEQKKLRDQSYSKGQEKGFKFIPPKKMDTKEYPRNNHTIEDQGQSWDFDAG